MAFSPEEQALIKPTCCTDNGEGCPDTEDNVFLLVFRRSRLSPQALARPG